MPDTNDAQSRGVAAAGGSGCVLFLVDESKAMHARVAGGTKSKAQSIATALNSLLNQLTAGPVIDVAVVGYRAARPGEDDVGPRWGGTLAGRALVATNELAGAPLTVETRVRKVPGSGGVGVAREESVQFPVWYVPRLGDAASRGAAFEHCRGMLSAWVGAAGNGCKPPMLVSFIGELEAQETAETVGSAIHQVETSGGPPLVLHAHLSTSDRVPAIVCPSSDAHLAPGPLRLLFEASSVLPDEFRSSLGQLQVNVNAGARGLIYNARMVDLIRLLSLVRAYARYQPPPRAAPPAAPGPRAEGLAPESLTVQMPAPDAPTAQFSGRCATVSRPRTSRGEVRRPSPSARALIVLLLDRSVTDPAGQGEKTVWHRLQEHANEILSQISKRGAGRIDCAAISYGTDASGRSEVAPAFSGPLAGRTLVSDTDLAARALRVEEVAEQVSNGIGGLVSVTRTRPIFVDLEPTGAAAPSPAFAAVKGLVDEWRERHAASRPAPVVLHVTRGRFEPDEIDRAVGQLGEAGPLALNHLVLTESPHPSLAYPAEPTKIREAALVKLWELTSPLPGSQGLAARKPAVTPESRGIVINGKFDLLLDGIQEALAAHDP